MEIPADEVEAKLIDESVLQAQQAQQGQVPESVDNQLNVTSQEDAKPIEEAVAVDAENVDRNDMINETDSIQLSGTDSSDIQSDSQSDGQGLEELDSDSKIDVSPEAGSEGESIIGWTDLAGDTLLQQIRTVLQVWNSGDSCSTGPTLGSSCSPFGTYLSGEVKSQYNSGFPLVSARLNDDVSALF